MKPQSRITHPAWHQPFDILRTKWHNVLAGDSRLSTDDLLLLPDRELKNLWETLREAATTGTAFQVRGWYHLLYADVLRGKRILDVGCGLGSDGVTFAQHDAHMTFVDIVESNLAVVERLCKLLGLTNVEFIYMRDIDSLSTLRADYDVVWCQGSLINAPFHVIRAEAQELLKHLKSNGRWIELAYPKARWEREGQLPFDRWGEHTDGPGTPWVEWYDLKKLEAALEPAEFEVVLYFEFHNEDFNWFDLKRRA
jgi:SAM-dependent methyltransferase